jgi:predicted MFS family arabinose efflux permease
VTGWLLDRTAPRIVTTAGALLIALGYVGAARSPSLTLITASLAVAGIGVGASTYVPAVTLATRWIAPRRQGLAVAALIAGASTGGVIFPVVLADITAAIGWRGAMLSIAALVALICAPLLLWLARLPPAPAAADPQSATAVTGRDIAQALRAPHYWLWITMLTLITLSGLGVYIALVPYLVSAGYSAQHAAAFYAVTGAVTLFGNLLFGVLGDRWGAKPVLLISTVLGAAGTVCLLAVRDPALGAGAIAFFSLAWGSTFNLVNQLSPLLLVEMVGPRNFGSLLGIGTLIAGLGSACSPGMIGYLVDITHAYTVPLLLCAGLMAVALLPIALLGRRPATQYGAP